MTCTLSDFLLFDFLIFCFIYSLFGYWYGVIHMVFLSGSRKISKVRFDGHGMS